MCLHAPNPMEQVTRLLQTVEGGVYYPLLLIAVITVPTQGLPNFLVYLAPRYYRMQKRKPQGNVWVWFKESISRTPAAAQGEDGNEDEASIGEDNAIVDLPLRNVEEDRSMGMELVENGMRDDDNDGERTHEIRSETDQDDE